MPLSVLAAAAILLSGAALLLVQLAMPNPGGAPSSAAMEEAPRSAPSSPAPVITGALRPSASRHDAADLSAARQPAAEDISPIDSVPIEALAARASPEESVPRQEPETILAETRSADTLTQEDRLPEAAPVETVPAETVEPEDAKVETVTEPAPAIIAPNETSIRSAPVTEAETKPREPARPQPPSAKAPSLDAREPPKQRLTEQSREAAQPAQPQLRAKPMTLGAAKQAANGISASAYASKVHAAIVRHRKRVAGANGSATVTFAIGPAGGLRMARISRSSGKPQLDQAALATVRSAAPFPPPPQGAKSTYSIQIYFR